MRKFIKKLIPHILIDFKNSFSKKKGKDLIFEKVNGFLATYDRILIEIGSGPKKGQLGWLTLDLLPGCDLQVNLLKKFPFPDNSVDIIYSSHFLEHFQTPDIKFILNECYRVLKPGGKISTCVPDASIYINAYTNNLELDQKLWFRYLPAADINTKIDYVNYIGHMNGEHKHLFDLDNLIAIHYSCGFHSTKRRQFDFLLDMRERDYESIYVEAIK